MENEHSARVQSHERPEPALISWCFLWPSFFFIDCHSLLKEKVIPKSLLFVSSPTTSKHSASFPSSKFQPLKCPLSWRNSSQKKQLRRPPFWNCLGSQAVFMWRHSVRLKIGGKEKNLQLNWRQPNLFFFQAIIHFTIFYAIISEFGAHLAQTMWLKSSHNPGW